MRHYTLTVTSKGQVTLPSEYRRAVGIDTGSRLSLLVDEAGDGRLAKQRGLRELAGSLWDLAEGQPPLTQSDIDESVADAMAEQEERSSARRRIRR